MIDVIAHWVVSVEFSATARVSLVESLECPAQIIEHFLLSYPHLLCIFPKAGVKS